MSIRKKVGILFTGGTISMTIDKEIGANVPTLSGEQIMSMATNVKDVADFEIKDFFPVVDDKTLSLYLRLKNERDVIFDNLPAGYKRLYSIAFDLAYRLYILRNIYNEGISIKEIYPILI